MKLTSADTLRALMAQKQVSYADLAATAEVSKGFISHLTSGRKNTCTPKVADRIVRRLDIPLQVLFMPSAPSTAGRSIPVKKVAA